MVVISCTDSFGNEVCSSVSWEYFYYGNSHVTVLHYGSFLYNPHQPVSFINYFNDLRYPLLLNVKRTYGYFILDETLNGLPIKIREFPLSNENCSPLLVSHTEFHYLMKPKPKKFLLCFCIENFTEVDFRYYFKRIYDQLLTIIKVHISSLCGKCGKNYKKRTGMEIFDDFVAVSHLSENGEFKIQIPVDSRNKPLIVQIKTFSTKLPFNFENKGKECSDDSDIIFDNNNEVTILRIQPQSLPFSGNYTSQNFMQYTSSITTSTDFRLIKNFDAVFNYDFIESKNTLSIDKCFDELFINKIYNNFYKNDVVIFAEYGVSLNYTGRIKSTHLTDQETDTPINLKVNNAIRSMTSRVYGFNLGFKFMRYNTLPFLDNSVLSQQFLGKIFENDRFGIYDMIRFVISDIGEYEWFAQPDVTQIQLRNEGYGVYIYFDKLGTYLFLTVTAGALPYVITEKDFPNKSTINLQDRDYGDLNINQSYVILRKTLSRLASNDEEYCLNMSFSNADNYYEKIENPIIRESSPRFRLFKPYVNEIINLKTDIIFDCPISFQPLFDLERNGNFLSLPVYGGLIPYLNIFYAYLFFKNFSFKNEKPIDENMFFLTGTGYFNFISGNITSYYNINGFYPILKKDDIFEKNVRDNLLNPPLKGIDFVRLQYVQIYRNRSYNVKVRETLENKISCLGILVKYTDLKAFLTNEGKYDTKLNVVEMIPTVTDYYPVRDLSNFNYITFLLPDDKPIYSEKPFQFRYQPIFNTDRDIICFKICGFDKYGNILKTKFMKGDEIMLKGSFVSRI